MCERLDLNPLFSLLAVSFVWLPAVALDAASETSPQGRIETETGQVWEGRIECAADGVQVESPGGETTRIGLSALRKLTLQRTEESSAVGGHDGMGLLGFYYPGTNFQGSPVIRLDPAVNFDWGWNISPLPGFRQDLFSARWTGRLAVPRTDVYTLYLGSDDGGRFWLGGQGPFSMWWRQDYAETNCTMRLEAGRPYDLRVEYFDYFGTARVDLSWSSSSFQKGPIPAEFLHPFSLVPRHGADLKLGAGLLASYHAGHHFGEPSFSRIEPAVALDYATDVPELVRSARAEWDRVRRAARDRAGSAADALRAAEEAFLQAAMGQGNEIVPDVPASCFTVRWSGWVVPPVAGVYSFRLLTDEGARLWLNDELIIDRWEEIYPGEYRHHAKLESARPVSVRIETLNTDGQAVAKLFWTQPGKDEAPLLGPILHPAKPLDPTRLPVGLHTQPGGILLTKGTFVPVLPEFLDATRLRLAGPVVFLTLPRPRLARVVFSPLTEEQRERLPPDRTGALLDNGDFVEGEVLGIDGTEARIDSVLFGRRRFHAPGPVSALILQTTPLMEPNYRLVLKGLGSVLTPEVKLTAEGIVVPELMDHAFGLGEVLELSRMGQAD